MFPEENPDLGMTAVLFYLIILLFRGPGNYDSFAVTCRLLVGKSLDRQTLVNIPSFQDYFM